MPRPIRICSVLDCQRTHYADGYCKLHYEQERRKALRVAYSPLSQPLTATPSITRDLGTHSPSIPGEESPSSARGSGFRNPGPPSPVAVAGGGMTGGTHLPVSPSPLPAFAVWGMPRV